MRISHVFIVCVLLVVCLACASELRADLYDLTTQSDYSTSWNGFDSDFMPYWKGETTVVETTPVIEQELNNIFSTASGSICMTSGRFGIYMPRVEQRWTVNKVHSSTRAATQTAAEYWLAGESFTASAGKSRYNSSYNSAELAHYAEIVTDDGRLLANASAIAYQNASLNDRSFSAYGRVSAATILKNGAASAESNAKGTSFFEAVYSLEKDTPFSFSVDMAKLWDVDLVFSAVDNHTGEALWDLTPAESGTWDHLEWNGMLEAGEYTFSLEAMAESLVDESGLQNAGGQAIFDVSLDFEAESYWVTIEPVFETLKLTGSLRINTPTNPPILVFSPMAINATGNLVSEVPEPGMIALLLAGFFCYGIRFLKRKSQRGRS